MGIVSKLTRRLDVPNEPGAWIEIRQLSWITLDKSRKVRLKELAELSGSFATGLNKMDSAEREAAKKVAAADPLAPHDMAILLKHGITSWSYGDPVTTDDLDERTAEWAAREILSYSVPTEAEKKTSASNSGGS